MLLHLIRHGETPSNVLGLLDTAHPGPGLTERGHAQARALIEQLSEQPVEAIAASQLVRTSLTGTPLAHHLNLGIEVHHGFHEIEAGQLEGLSDQRSVLRYLETVGSWGLGELDARMPGGGDGHEFFGRFNESLDAVQRTGVNTAAVFSHGAAIRVWAARHATNIDPAFAAHNRLENTGVLTLSGSSRDGWRLLSWSGAVLPEASDSQDSRLA